MKTPIIDRRIEILQYLFDNDAIATEEIKELMELKAMKEALSKSSVGKSLLEEYPNFEQAFSVRKLHKDLENPICKCKGGYCYARNKKGDIVKPCEL